MIPLFKVNMNQNAVHRVDSVLKSGNITIGPVVDEFESLLAMTLMRDNVITTNSATSAIDLALELIGVGPGDEVISTPQTCFASNIGAIHRGARIRWADIDPVTGLIDPAHVATLVTDKTKAIIAVNWAGVPADYVWLKSFGIPVIEDAAHCWDVWSGQTNRENGDYTVYSFQAIKFLTTGDGGALVTPADRAHEATLLRWYGLDRKIGQSFRLTQDVPVAGFKYNMNDISASIGLANLPMALAGVRAHRENAKRFTEAFQDLPFILPQTYDHSASYWIYPMVMSEGYSKGLFCDYMEECGIATNMVHYRNDRYGSTEHFSEGRLPGVDYFTEHQTNIPVGWWLSTEDVDHIIDSVRDYTE